MIQQAVAWSAAASAVFAPLALLVLVKLFPNLFAKLLTESFEQRNRKALAAYKDELDRASALAVEHAKAEIAGSYDTLRTSMDFLTASQSGLRGHSVEAVKALWENMIAVREAHAGLLAFEHVLTEDEKHSIFSGEDDRGLQFIEQFRSEATIHAMAKKFADVAHESHRPFCGERLWLIYMVYRNAHLRGAYLTQRGLEEGHRANLLDDRGILQLLGAVLADKAIAQAKRLPINNFGTLLAQLEAVFLQEAAMVMSGSKAVAETLADMQSTLLLQNRVIAEVRGRS